MKSHESHVIMSGRSGKGYYAYKHILQASSKEEKAVSAYKIPVIYVSTPGFVSPRQFFVETILRIFQQYSIGSRAPDRSIAWLINVI
jgi:hypothetical protein